MALLERSRYDAERYGETLPPRDTDRAPCVSERINVQYVPLAEGANSDVDAVRWGQQHFISDERGLDQPAVGPEDAERPTAN